LENADGNFSLQLMGEIFSQILNLPAAAEWEIVCTRNNRKVEKKAF
jgi:hypothetical protein